MIRAVPASFEPGSEETEEVARLIGREPMIPFRVALRGGDGRIVVTENLPQARSGAPNPNWFWLVDRLLTKEVDRLESAGGVRLAESLIAPELVLRTHHLYRSGRAQLSQELGLEPLTGGVGGARAGVKCLHAHLAFRLAGGYSPVGVWVMDTLCGIPVRR